MLDAARGGSGSLSLFASPVVRDDGVALEEDPFPLSISLDFYGLVYSPEGAPPERPEDWRMEYRHWRGPWWLFHDVID